MRLKMKKTRAALVLNLPFVLGGESNKKKEKKKRKNRDILSPVALPGPGEAGGGA